MTINHPRMTPAWFDAAVHRAMCDGCRVIQTRRPGVLFVTSGSVAGLTYRVTRTTCTCPGHAHVGRCKHRALAIAHADVFRRPDPPTPAAPAVTTADRALAWLDRMADAAPEEPCDFVA